ncbi:serine/threonine-protein kinase [Thiosocius teredinicola]|uniref:serine/threonine-protein kinase n=1 Tax=Thiosocius teredinicola TaxID=1973002 RepID=UPI00099124BC
MSAPKFKVKKRIAKGGMSSVYLAVQESLGRRVALKLMRKFDNPKQAERFLHEGRIIASLGHRNIITIHDVGVIGDRHFISMEYLEGGSLEDRIGENGMPPAKALSILEQIAGCLRFVHRKGIVHRDIKPGNILFHSDGTPKLTDFGIAKLLDSDQDLTMDGAALGSPYYLSPEQAEGRPLDGRTDIYALGIVLYQMLTGQKPFAKASPIETIVAHLTQPIPLLPHELSGYQPLLDRMIAKNPEDRVGSAKELVYMMRELRRSPPEPLSVHGPRDGSFQTGSRLKEIVAAAFTHNGEFSLPKSAAIAGGILAVILGGALLMSSDPDTPDALADSDSAARVEVVENTGALEDSAPADKPPSQTVDLPVIDAAPSTAATSDATPDEAQTQIIESDSPAIATSSGESHTATLSAPDEPAADDTASVPGTTFTADTDAPESYKTQNDILATETDSADETAELAEQTQTDEPADGEVSDTTAPVADDVAALHNAEDDKTARVDELKQLARRALERNRLTTPAKDNAYSYFEQILEVDPENTTAKRGMQAIIDRYADLALGAMQAGSERRAQIYLRRGLRLQPRNRALLAARREINEIREARIAAAQQPPEPVISVAEPVAVPNQNQGVRGREGSGNIVKDFKSVWRAIFD